MADIISLATKAYEEQLQVARENQSKYEEKRGLELIFLLNDRLGVEQSFVQFVEDANSHSPVVDIGSGYMLTLDHDDRLVFMRRCPKCRTYVGLWGYNVDSLADLGEAINNPARLNYDHYRPKSTKKCNYRFK